MKTIKQLITSHLKRVIILSEAVLLVVVFLAQVKVTQHQMVETAMERFSQIRHFLAVNEMDLTKYDVPEAGNGYELSDILSNLSVYEDAELYVLNLETQMVLGSTSPENVGKTLSELGFDFARTQREKAGFHATVHNEDVFCVFEELDGYLYGRIIPIQMLYADTLIKVIELTVLFFVVTAIMLAVIKRYVDKHLIRSIHGINETLSMVTAGYLDKRVEEGTSVELAEMGRHINQMVDSLSVQLDYEHQYQAELTEALKLADSANRSKSQFLFSMSHDIRTPMNAILGFASMAERHADDKEKVLDCVKKISAAGDHLLGLINDVLDMARIESGKMSFDEQPHSIADAVAMTEALFAQDMQKKNIAFSVHFDVEDEVAYYDSIRMDQVVLNLVSNAMKYTPEGGSVTYTLTQIGKTDDGYGTYQGVIKDTGIGMSEEFVQKVFEPFERERNSTVSGIQGTGLGLAITKRIIEYMGGILSCQSTLGEGSEFTFVVHLKTGTRADLPEEQQGDVEIPDFSDVRILLAEDNELNREIAYEILTEFGLSVDTAEDGAIAVEKVASAAPGYYDLVLMDVQMPNMDGYQATEAIRGLENQELANIPVIAFTANVMDTDKQRAYAAGMNGCLTKPIEMEMLISTLARFCKK